jgi:hypothetical protein
MSGYTTETQVTTTTRRAYRVSATDGGADYQTVADASATAWTEYRDKAGLPEGADIPPGVLRFQPGDGQIVISWSVEEVA